MGPSKLYANREPQATPLRFSMFRELSSDLGGFQQPGLDKLVERFQMAVKLFGRAEDQPFPIDFFRTPRGRNDIVPVHVSNDHWWYPYGGTGEWPCGSLHLTISKDAVYPLCNTSVTSPRARTATRVHGDVDLNRPGAGPVRHPAHQPDVRRGDAGADPRHPPRGRRRGGALDHRHSHPSAPGDCRRHPRGRRGPCARTGEAPSAAPAQASARAEELKGGRNVGERYKPAIRLWRQPGSVMYVETPVPAD